MIYLLDLNYTLVTNSTVKKSPFIRQIEQEAYSQELVKRLRGERVILITARPDKYRETTLQRIAEMMDWRPEAAYFNDRRLPPPVLKSRLIVDTIRPEFGDDESYFGIESNPRTRSAYEKLGIGSCTRDEFLSNENSNVMDVQERGSCGAL